MGTNQKKKRMIKRQAIGLVIIAVLLFFGTHYVNKIYTQSGMLRVSFESPEGERTPEFLLEVAASRADRARGLMFRREMDLDKGMMFVFPSQENQSFWMKNTFISLDIIFLDRNLEVVGVLHELPVMSETSRRVERPSMYAVELNAGKARKYGIKEGHKANVRGTIPPGE